MSPKFISHTHAHTHTRTCTHTHIHTRTRTHTRTPNYVHKHTKIFLIVKSECQKVNISPQTAQTKFHLTYLYRQINPNHYLHQTNTLQNLEKRNPGRLFISQLNIKSMWNKLEFLRHIAKDNIEMLMQWRIKLDSSFLQKRFYIEGYSKPHWLNNDQNAGGIMIFIREKVPSKTKI